MAGEGTLARLREAGCAAGCPTDLLCQSLDLMGTAWEMRREAAEGFRGRVGSHLRSSRLRASIRWNEAVVSDCTRFPGAA